MSSYINVTNINKHSYKIFSSYRLYRPVNLFAKRALIKLNIIFSRPSCIDLGLSLSIFVCA